MEWLGAGLLLLALPFRKFRALWPKTEVGCAVTCMLSVCTCGTEERKPKALNFFTGPPELHCELRRRDAQEFPCL